MNRSELPAFAYSDLPVHVAASVRGHTVEIKRLVAVIAQNVWLAGQHLAAVKDALEHGQWLAWLNSEFSWSRPTADRWMQVYRQFPENAHGEHFSMTALYLLAANNTPDEAKTIALECAQNGEFITVERAKAIIVAVRETLADDTLTPRQRVSTMQSLTDEIESAGTVSIGGFSVPATDETVPLAAYDAVAQIRSERADQIARHSQWEQCQSFEAITGLDAVQAFEDAQEALTYGEPVLIRIYRKKETK